MIYHATCGLYSAVVSAGLVPSLKEKIKEEVTMRQAVQLTWTDMATLYKHIVEQVAEAPAAKGLSIICTAAVAILVIVALLKPLYYRTWHPLSRFPGPPAAASSRHWIYRVTDRGFPEEDLEKLHKKYREFCPAFIAHLITLH